MRIWHLYLLAAAFIGLLIYASHTIRVPVQKVREQCAKQRYVENFTRELCGEYGAQAESRQK